MNRVEQRLSHLHGKEQARLVGSGTMGLIAALKVLGLEGKRVGVPNNVCFSVPQAIIYAGAQPVYFDVEEGNFGLSPESAVVAEGLSALIAVHAYGRICSIECLREICDHKGWYLIEDFAVAQGAVATNGPVGCYGEISVTSFGAGKIIDIGHGGAVLTDNKKWADEMKCFSDSQPDFNEIDQNGMEKVSCLHTHLYNTQFLTNRNVDIENFRSAIDEYRECYFYCWNGGYQYELERKLDELSINLKGRRVNAERLAMKLRQIPGVKVIEHDAGEVYWRLNLMVEERRDELFRMLLDKRYPVSSWHPSVSHFLEPHTSRAESPVSDEIGEKIINLWINDQVDERYIDGIGEEIKNFFATENE